MTAKALKEIVLSGIIDNATSKHGVFIIKLNGISLYAKLKKVMHRPKPYAPYEEIDGVAYTFVDDNGIKVDNFEGTRKHDSIGFQGTFDYLSQVIMDATTK